MFIKRPMVNSKEEREAKQDIKELLEFERFSRDKENKNMSKAYEFLKECGIFFVLTLNDDYPAGRPFGVVMEVGEDLYISTNDFNQAHKQLRTNGHIQIIAKKQNSREWIRITGTATECDDAALKQKMYEENPILQKHHDSAEAEHFLMFKIRVEKVEMK